MEHRWMYDIVNGCECRRCTVCNKLGWCDDTSVCAGRAVPKHQWVELTTVNDVRRNFLCVLTGQKRWEEYYVSRDGWQDDDEEILRQLGHGLVNGQERGA